MFKKALQIVVTFGLLVAAYRAYLVAFALLTGGADERGPAVEWVAHEGKFAREANRLASLAFGESHWTADPKLNLRYYDAARGFFMYAGNQERLEKGKKLRLWPFAIIWLGKDGRGIKTATSAEALIELNAPLGLSSKAGSSPMHVVEARLEQDVTLRDDKGTPFDKSDDTVVDGDGAPLPYIEYTEKSGTPEIRTKSRVRVVDQKLTLTGVDMTILLRKPQPGSQGGFDADRAILRKDVQIRIVDAGKGGVMPGQSRGGGKGPTPTTIRAEGGWKDEDAMQVDLPRKPRPLRPWEEGPPDLEGPTLATFRRNVEVARGLGEPDKLTSDTLVVTLMPGARRREIAPLPGGAVVVLGAACLAPGAGGAMPRDPIGGDAGGPLGSLELRRAQAKGFAVWLVSPSQGVESKCNELIYKKQLPDAADETYLRADARPDGAPPLWVEKVDREGSPEAPGAITSVTNVWAVDATIFDDGKGGSASSVVARGPGKLESRAGNDRSKDYEATWADELVVRTLDLTSEQLAAIAASLPKDKPPPKRREVTLKGEPVLIDHKEEMTLSARASVFASLLPNPGAPKKPAGDAPGGALGSGSTRIEHVIARDQVVLTTPGRTMRARDVLDTRFEDVAPPPAAVASATAAPAPSVAPAPPIAPTPTPKDEPKPKAAPGPAVMISAHRIWPTIRRLPGGKTELAKAMLRGEVRVHQDPSPEKPRGTDAWGEALDIRSVGAGLMRFDLADAEPTGRGELSRVALRDGAKLDPRPIAVIQTEDYLIRGHLLHLDQAHDLAWSDGPGTLTQMAERGFLNDKGVQKRVQDLARMTPEEREKEKKKKSPLTIAWSESMRFYGRTTDPEKRPTAKAEFRGKVDAVSEEYHIVADEIDTYTDRPVSLAAKQKPAPATSANPDDTPAPEEPKPELTRLEARSRRPWKANERGVVVLNTRRDDATGELIERQRIDCGTVRYDKRTGNYLVPGPGMVRLWRRSAEKPKDGAKPEGPKAYGGWELTEVAFKDEMRGRFGAGEDEEKPEPRTADFYGGVTTASAPVENEATSIDFDRQPRGTRYLTSDRLRIVDFPPPKGVKDVAAYQIITADGGIVQAHDDTAGLQADYIHYDTQKGQFYAYGEQGRKVVMTRQNLVGQEATVNRADAFLYNTKTKEVQDINPFQILMFDGKGTRLTKVAAPGQPGDPAKPKPKRQPLRPPPRGNIERRDFFGG